MYVYSGSSWDFVIGNTSMEFITDSPSIARQPPCIIRLPTGNLMAVIDGDAFVVSIEGMFVKLKRTCIHTFIQSLY